MLAEVPIVNNAKGEGPTARAGEPRMEKRWKEQLQCFQLSELAWEAQPGCATRSLKSNVQKRVNDSTRVKTMRGLVKLAEMVVPSTEIIYYVIDDEQ